MGEGFGPEKVKEQNFLDDLNENHRFTIYIVSQSCDFPNVNSAHSANLSVLCG